MSATDVTRTTIDPAMDAQVLHAALSSTPRPPRPSAWSAAMTFGWRGMLKVKHVPEQALDATVTPVLFLVMFTYLFGGAVAGGTDAYLQYILPGILVQSVLFTAVYAGVGLNTDVTKGVVDRFRTLPIWRPAPLVGAVLGDSVRYVLASVIVVALGFILGFSAGGGIGGVAGGHRARRGVRLRPVVGVHDARHAAARAERGDERRLHGPVPARVPQQHAGRAEHAARRGWRRSSTSTRSRMSSPPARAHGGQRRRRATSCWSWARPRCSPRSSRR